jgi:Uma2 family endonuclease
MTAARRTTIDLPQPMTADEFFEMPDDGTDEKYELIDGYLVAMAPTSPVHSLLQAKLARLIGNHLSGRNSPCWVGTETGVQPVIRKNDNVRIPDLGVSCTPLDLGDKSMQAPILLVEVLSPSNAKSTQANLWMYATMASVAEVLLVHTEGARIELFQRRADGQLADAIIADVGQAVRLDCIGMDLGVDELYHATPLADIAFKEEKEQAMTRHSVSDLMLSKY